ncbi:DUF2304 domain-containing protein [Microbacterium plantarum]|uniref:DUF2304 domain-containing protein n=1 Tax=Microbacterium plantarum TaxID=1816425 RepID=UPI002B4A61B2|nr:DUF2304 domain-containing protein [Microbacterium plantarum]WRK16651.1 DUF2304 domain-containing protein [Microbacterium plantarum]
MIVPIGIAFAVVILAIIVTMLLRRHLREKYAVMWLVIGVAMLALALFPDLLGALAGVLGVIVPSNLLFALAVALLIGVALHLSWELSRAEEEIRRIAEEVAILRVELDELRGERSSDHPLGAVRDDAALPPDRPDGAAD